MQWSQNAAIFVKKIEVCKFRPDSIRPDSFSALKE